jgi:hypothetical protein
MFQPSFHPNSDSGTSKAETSQHSQKSQIFWPTKPFAWRASIAKQRRLAKNGGKMPEE